MINKLILVLLIGFYSITSNAEGLYAFTEHQVITIINGKTFNENAPTGDLPYIGKLGIKYKFKNINYGVGYLHRSNLDISGKDEYNYDSFFFSAEIEKCMLFCK